MTRADSNLDLPTTLRAAEARYADANPASAAAFEAARRHMPGGNTRTVLYYPPFPLTLTGGKGCHVTDVDGHRYVDAVCEQTAGLYGHDDPRIEAAVIEALKQGIVLGGPTGRETEFADLVCARFPAIELVRFTNSGTEANLYALCAARAVTERPAILAFDGSYHGGAMSFGGYGNAMNVPFPYVMGTYNDTAKALELIDAHAHELAAVILEPMVGGGGCIPATAEFVSALREATTRHGIVLIFDEVMTSRLSPSGLHGALGVTPDLVTLGKYLGGGLTFGAFGGRADIMARFDPTQPAVFGHAGTFNNNVLSLAAGITGLRDLLTPEVSVRLNEDGDRLRARLNDELASRGLPGAVTGRGSMMMVHLADGTYERPQDTARVLPELRALCHLEMLDAGIYLSRRNMINLSLPMGEAEFDAIAGAFGAFLDRHAGLVALA
ncbi:MAG TPA: aminotransferase class III-fold pyridoxal phosphate-dependent enzyme [Pseudomonadales bacterium]|nr:aminotransferase class III-fold pyridoxal phosphate-dependent enzyme [Pseudomonadales bacterium]